ncbi:MAG: DUF481 domain-containing protein [Pseudomonadales bacterium]|nr:DUF481 domain-containing protein [Pseudomonadales bacterium]
MRCFKPGQVFVLLLMLLGSQTLSAQSAYEFSSELELGAIFTSGNTEDENIKFKGTVSALRDAWEHSLSLDGFRSSKENELAAQRIYTVASSNYSFRADHFVQARLAHEDDRFSGFDSQSDLSVSYGQLLLRNRTSMTLDYTVGAGIRTSRAPEDDFNESILRFSTNYSWNLSENAQFRQTFSIESGDTSSISRSETSLQSDIMENLSMKFSIKVKHQSEVPVFREKTDTETSITLLLRL